MGSNNTVKRNKSNKTKSLPKTPQKNVTEAKRNMYEQFVDIDPLYLAKKMKQSMIRKFSFFPKTLPNEISILIPNLAPDNKLFTTVYNSMSYDHKTFFKWYLDIMDRRFDMTQAIYGPNYFVYMNHIFVNNQKMRWAFKKLLTAWIIKKSKKKCIGTEDIVTGDKIKEADKIQIYCLKSRCMYAFSGNSLLKSICSNLETQVNCLPMLVTPKNPYTNMNFEYGQLLQIYNETLAWCAKRKKAFPTAFALYRDANFQLVTMAKMHNYYLQYKAMHNYTTNDDIDSSFFIETIAEIIKINKSFLLVNNIKAKHLRVVFFSKWIERDPRHYLLKQWYNFVTDYSYHAQTGVFARDCWNSVIHIMYDLKILFQASLPYL